MYSLLNSDVSTSYQPWWYDNNPHPYARETIDHRIPSPLTSSLAARNQELVAHPNEAQAKSFTHSQGLDFGEEYLQQMQRENPRGRQEMH